MIYLFIYGKDLLTNKRMQFDTKIVAYTPTFVNVTMLTVEYIDDHVTIERDVLMV